jgi:tetratricopeptide (TPR) repeat protein
MLVRQGLSLYKELNNIKGICYALTHIGRVLRKSGKCEIAEKYFNKAFSLAQKYKYGDEIAATHFQVAKLSGYQKKWEDAKTHWEEAIRWCEEHEDDANLDISFFMGCIGNLGWVEFRLGNYLRSKELIERSLEFFKQFGGKGYTAILNLRLATIERTLGNRENALEYLQKTLFWAERLGMKRELHIARALLTELEQVQAADSAGE